MRIAVTRRIPDEGLRILADAADVLLWEDSLPPTREDLIGLARDADGLLSLLTDRIDHERLDQLPRLRAVSNMAVGYDNIDLDACTSHGVAVCTTPDVLTETTADFTFALMLAAARRLTEAADAARRGDWRTWEPMGYLGTDIHSAALGIIGMGRIGTAVARRAAGFGMRIRYTSRSPRAVPNAEPVPMETLLSASDFVSLHVPLGPETTGLIDRRALSLMRPSAILVNTSRGPVVDTDSLTDPLRRRRIRYRDRQGDRLPRRGRRPGLVDRRAPARPHRRGCARRDRPRAVAA